MQKITPVIWFDNNAEEAMNTYVALFEDAKVVDLKRYPDGAPGLAGKVMNGRFHLAGFEIMAMDAGPDHKPTPALSFFVDCASTQEVDTLFEKLSDGGSVLMPLQAYPFSDRYAWIEDRFGVSWQLNLTGGPRQVTPALLFVGDQHGNAEAAMQQYVKLFPQSNIDRIERYAAGEGGAEGAVKYAEFSLHGQRFRAMESDLEHAFGFTEGISLLVECSDQADVDHYWDHLGAGGEEQMCGWLKDRYGVSWQIIPSVLPRLLTDPDPEKAQHAMHAMLQMKRIDVAALRRAGEGA